MSTPGAGATTPRELQRGTNLAIWALLLATAGFCSFPIAIAAIIEGVRALSRGRAPSGSSAQIMAIIALCLAPISFVSGLGVCTAVAIPAFVKYMRRSKVSEAEHNVDALYEGVVRAHSRTGALPESLAPTPAEAPCADRRPWPGDAAPGWTALGFSPTDPLYYSYEVEVSPDGRRVDVRARGDLDCDGVQSLFEREGIVEGHTIRGQRGIYVERETE